MKIGLLADIHGDLANLKTALNLLETHKVDEILCAGDLVDRGEKGNAVVQLMQQQGIPTVQGNHDATPFDLHYLSEKTIKSLKQLPPVLRFHWEEVSLCLAHGTPLDPWRYVFPESSPQLYEDVFYQARTNIVVLGHTHQPMIVHIHSSNQWVFNPGAVSRLCANTPTCAILTLPVSGESIFDFRVFALATNQQVKPKYTEIAGNASEQTA